MKIVNRNNQNFNLTLLSRRKSISETFDGELSWALWKLIMGTFPDSSPPTLFLAFELLISRRKRSALTMWTVRDFHPFNGGWFLSIWNFLVSHIQIKPSRLRARNEMLIGWKDLENKHQQTHSKIEGKGKVDFSSSSSSEKERFSPTNVVLLISNGHYRCFLILPRMGEELFSSQTFCPKRKYEDDNKTVCLEDWNKQDESEI